MPVLESSIVVDRDHLRSQIRIAVTMLDGQVVTLTLDDYELLRNSNMDESSIMVWVAERLVDTVRQRHGQIHDYFNDGLSRMIDERLRAVQQTSEPYDHPPQQVVKPPKAVVKDRAVVVREHLDIGGTPLRQRKLRLQSISNDQG